MYGSYSFIISALDGGEWSASRPGRALTPGKWTPSTHCTGSWVGPRTGLDTKGRRKILSPLPGIEPRSPGRSYVVPIQTEFTKARRVYHNFQHIVYLINKSVALQALTNLGRLSSRRWQSFPTTPDGTGWTCGQHIESHSCIFSFPNRTVTALFK
jgi:hypothetical protein